jgi:hypothetical protein
VGHLPKNAVFGRELSNSGVLFHEFRQTHASLKLNLAFQHRCAPCGINDVSKSNYRLMG